MTIKDSSIFIGGGGGASATPWVSGETVPQWAWKISPADKEIYQRITAAGGGTTDPAADTTNYISRSWVRPGLIQQGRTNAPVASPGSVITSTFVGATVSSGDALALNVRTSMLAVSGRGVLTFCACANFSASSFILPKLEIIVDGRTLYDRTITFNNNGPAGLAIVGNGAPSGNQPFVGAVPSGNIPFKQSLAIYVTATSSAIAAGNFSLGYIYNQDA